MVLPRLPKQIAEKARGFACGLYKNVPQALIPNAGDDALRFVWDNICDPPSNPQEPPLPGLPPPPTTPYLGGKCPTFYEVTCDIVFYNSDTVTQTSENKLQLRGPIQGVLTERTGNATSGYAFTHNILGTAVDGSVTKNRIAGGSGGAHVWKGYCNIKSVRRLDGQPDNCGNPPKQYPNRPPAPPTGFLSPPTPIVLNDNDNITINFRLVPPTLPPLPNKFPDINIDVESPKFDIPISFNFNGDINFGAPTPPPPPEGIEDLKDKIDNLDDKIDNITNNNNNTDNKLDDFFKDFNFNFNPPPFPDSPEVEKIDNPPDDEGEKQVEDLLGVVVVLTKMPDKAQFGSPTCYFAGWLTFLNQGGYEPRYQINFAEGYFPAPPGCTGYAYTFTNGAEGAIREYRKVREV